MNATEKDNPNLSPALPELSEWSNGFKDWPHAPPHRLKEAGVFFVTSRTAEQRHLLDTPARRDWFQNTLFKLASQYEWKLEAWAILSNHYHFIAHSPVHQNSDAKSLSGLIRHLHSASTKYFNVLDGTPGRSRLWQNFRETRLNLIRGYLARLHYVHQNAVHHKLVSAGSDWKWCSARAFRMAVTPAWLKTVASFRYEQIACLDGE